ncbi:MAG: HEPN domain-containing protein [Thermoguttaceae bacterium]
MEKYLKALLIHHGVMPPKTHDLVLLDGLLTPVCDGWSWPLEELRFLTRAAVAFRYPGESADKEEAIEALKITRKTLAKMSTIIQKLISDPNTVT